MANYPLICKKCGHTSEAIDSPETIVDNLENGMYCCEKCGYPMKQDFSGKTVGAHYHPTRDLYAQDLKQRARKKHARGTYYDR